MTTKIVILVDIDKINEGYFEKLLYTGIPRAKVNLFFFCTQEIKNKMDERYIAGIKKLI